MSTDLTAIVLKFFYKEVKNMFLVRLKTLMDEQCNGKQTILATKSNLPKSVISSYFCRGSQPSLSQLIALSKALNCTIDYLAGIEPDIEDNIFLNAKKNSFLQNEELKLLQNFRSLPQQEKAQASEYVNYLAEKRGNKNKYS